VVGQGLVEVVAQVPSQGQAVCHRPHELALRAEVLEEHDQLELEEDDRVNGRPAAPRVERGDELPDEREVQPRLQAAVEVVFGHQILQGQVTG
jgi:hypothetical protein